MTHAEQQAQIEVLELIDQRRLQLGEPKVFQGLVREITGRVLAGIEQECRRHGCEVCKRLLRA